MLTALSWGDIAALVAPLLIGGVVTGILAGLLGVGGGAVIVPVLYEVFRAVGVDESVRMQLCVGTSLAIIVPTSLQSYRTHKARGAVIPGVLRTWSIPAILGIVTGSAIAAVVEGWVLQAAFVVIALLMATKVLSGRDDWRIAGELPGRRMMWVYGFIVGLAASLIGISGGGLATILLSLYGVPIHAAVATAAGIGMLVPIPGVIGYAIGGWPHLSELPPLSIGYVSLLGFACMAPVSTLVAPFGARLAHSLSRRALEIGFGVFLLLMAARFFIAIVWG
ncbi:sulfite exporter TauE/SafE family protein [Aquabacter spiritensis]|uniref:Probable membrane transporter protein n=1 Tax=Aquabacter spiritensis TaxID=933073 RepID=A0A4R3LWF4_9HYPH|nr:sulfite exporter TauE/SafE family protein [Aquabacter spiritensis]TCT02847.1 putative membrane protein YfcA [Aquabacter spiritensis]